MGLGSQFNKVQIGWLHALTVLPWQDCLCCGQHVQPLRRGYYIARELQNPIFDQFGFIGPFGQDTMFFHLITASRTRGHEPRRRALLVSLARCSACALAHRPGVVPITCREDLGDETPPSLLPNTSARSEENCVVAGK